MNDNFDIYSVSTFVTTINIIHKGTQFYLNELKCAALAGGWRLNNPAQRE